MKFTAYYPVRPLKLTQSWGTYDPKNYNQFGFSRHNGIDCAISPDALIRAPFNGTIIRTGNQPAGGGIFCGLLSDDEFEFDSFICKTPDLMPISFPATTCRVLFDFLHMDRLDVGEGQKIKMGDVLGIQGNTGFSTGPHTHIQCRREYLELVAEDVKVAPSYKVLGTSYLTDVDKNAANNSFDPSMFWNGVYASEAVAETQISTLSDTVMEIIKSTAPVQQKITILSLIKKVVEWIFKSNS